MYLKKSYDLTLREINDFIIDNIETMYDHIRKEIIIIESFITEDGAVMNMCYEVDDQN